MNFETNRTLSHSSGQTAELQQTRLFRIVRTPAVSSLEMAREDMHALRHRHHNAKKHAGVVEAKGETNVEKIGSGEHSSYPPKTTATAIDPVWSSGVPFYPPSKKFWRIGNEWYDFTKFADKVMLFFVPLLT